MRNLNILNQFRLPLMGQYGDSSCGFFIIPSRNNNNFYQVIASSGEGWDHVSVCLLDRKGRFVERTLTWNEMCLIKNIFFNDDEDAVEFHPRKQDYIDEHHYVLHIWRANMKEFPLPKKEDYDTNNNIQNINIPRKNGYYNISVIQTNDWKRIRVSLLNRWHRQVKAFPTWDDMCIIKDLFFNDDEATIEIHPSDEYRIHEKDYTIDLWKPLNKEMPLPNPNLVGKVKKYPNKV